MGSGGVEMRLEVGLADDADAAELDQETAQLREELLQLAVDTVDRPQGEPPPEGARAVEATILGTLLVGAGTEAIGAVVRTLQSWISRRPDRTIKIQLGGDTIELSSASEEDQERLVEAFVARQRAEP